MMRLFRNMRLGLLAVSCALAVAPLGTAYAADLITVPTSTAAELPVYDDVAFDWNGFYAGIYGGVQNSTNGGTQWALGVQAGVNTRIDDFLLGSEIAVHGLAGGLENSSYGQILGRFGLIVTDDVAVYAAAGYGIDLGPPAEQDVLLGGGLELAVTDSLSLRAQYLHGFPVEGGNPKDQVTMGANFHF